MAANLPFIPMEMLSPIMRYRVRDVSLPGGVPAEHFFVAHAHVVLPTVPGPATWQLLCGVEGTEAASHRHEGALMVVWKQSMSARHGGPEDGCGDGAGGRFLTSPVVCPVTFLCVEGAFMIAQLCRG